VGGAISGLVVLGSIREQAEQTKQAVFIYYISRHCVYIHIHTHIPITMGNNEAMILRGNKGGIRGSKEKRYSDVIIF
jgi:hypothetical protein